VLGGGGSTVEKRMKYLLLPKEVEAHSAQFYFLSKRRKQPWKAIVTNFLNQQFEAAAEQDLKNVNNTNKINQLKDEATKAVAVVFNAWAEYTAKRFPTADTDIDVRQKSKPTEPAVKNPENFTNKKSSDQEDDYDYFLRTGEIRW